MCIRDRRLPDLDNYPEIKPNYVSNYQGEKPWKAYRRDKDTQVRYWAIPGMEGFAHRLGGLEKDYDTSAISTDPINHQKMVTTRQAKIDKIADFIPELEAVSYTHLDVYKRQVINTVYKIIFTIVFRWPISSVFENHLEG